MSEKQAEYSFCDIKYKKQRENVEEYKKHIKLKNNISIGGETFSVTEYLKILLPYISASLYSTNAAHDTSVSAVILNKKNPTRCNSDWVYSGSLTEN